MENVNLRTYSAMRLGGEARYFCEVRSPDDVTKAVNWAKNHHLPMIVVGQGSNIVWRDEGFNGLLIVNHLMGREILEEDKKSATIRVGAGEVWDEIVAWTVKKGLSGIEFLSAIPGLAGAAPVQNIGAYGAELTDTLTEVEVYDTLSEAFETLPAVAGNFAYRTSRFKTSDKGRFIILSLTLKLKKQNPKPPFYESLQNYFTQHNINEFTPETVRQAVMEIRKIKLPDPSVVSNNGSFFTNPIVDKAKYEQLKAKCPDIKAWPAKNGKIKLSAGWLVEEAGFKDVHDLATGMGTWPAHALVLVNEHAKSTADLLAFKQKIQAKVHQMFGIVLEQEPELLP